MHTHTHTHTHTHIHTPTARDRVFSTFFDEPALTVDYGSTDAQNQRSLFGGKRSRNKESQIYALHGKRLSIMIR